ncbi:MAG: PilZ domain-containing protein [Endomicrobia bacterium]|nr:PilZ domain-containing protein [Endomicrobiia bacterium]
MEKNNKFSGIERREYRRLNVLHLSIPIQIKTSDIPFVVPGVLLDISAGGIGVLLFKELHVGTIIELYLNLNNVKTDIIRAKVMWVKPVEKTYRIGMKFIEISKKDFLQISNYVDSHIKEDL